ncbi:hypothetical protein J1N35_012685 [Gossypium stocksii]|uniref:Uncharacterized protein n=1 Tax=Gossypium stocksii TaxID=47602 RepID=A0A9D3W5X0_9ROSI|nr:hypothetical protein J1N35_012685 [Gossypium stocksii]
MNSPSPDRTNSNPTPTYMIKDGSVHPMLLPSRNKSKTQRQDKSKQCRVRHPMPLIACNLNSLPMAIRDIKSHLRTITISRSLSVKPTSLTGKPYIN